MNAIDRLVGGIKHVDNLLAEEILEPDLGRDDWSGLRARVKLVEDAIQGDVLGAFDEAARALEGTEAEPLMRRRVAGLVAEAAAPIYATGDRKTFLSLLARAAQIADDEDQRAELEAAPSEPEAYVRLQHARWLQDHARHREADKVLKRVLREVRSPALKRAAKRAKNAPRPLTGAPPLFRLNGCGAGLYGERDAGPDGSYVATYCISLLWIPVLPLAAYRVRRVADDAYQFGAKEVLGPIARVWQAIVLACAVIGIGWGAVSSYRDSPSYRANAALEEARAAEASGDREGAIERYKNAIRAHEGSVDLAPAAESVIRLSAASVAEPATPDAVDRIGRVASGYYDLPPGVRAGAATALLAKRLGAWAEQIGDATPAQANAGLAVLDMASRVADGSPEAPWVEERRAKLRRGLADRVAAERPLQALDLYTQLGDPAALDAARQILDSFGDAPSLWIEAQVQVERWLEGAVGAKRLDEEGRVVAKLASAREGHAKDLALIEAGDDQAIAKAFAERPDDQELAVAVAALRRGQGDPKGARALLEKLGPPGRLTSNAQQLLGNCHADTGDLAKADEILGAFLAERLPPFQQAQREYTRAAQQAQDRIVKDIQLGIAPPELEARMRAASEDEQREIFRSWLGDQMDKDPALARLRAEYLRHAAVVPASISLGMVKLRRANEAGGDARKALLGEAERVFLSIRTEAEGDPTFHLGLGEIYHRLGRTEDGDKEFQGLLDRKDAVLGLAVARAYRALGLETRSKQVAQGVYDTAPEASHKYAAASLIALLASDIDEEEQWLRRSDASSPEVKNQLAKVEAARLLREGKHAEADRVLVKVLAFHERDAKRDATAANNAAIMYLARYTATGDGGHLRAAVRHLETSARLEGENALVLGNLANALEHLGLVTVLDQWVQSRALMLEGADARSLLDALLDGPLREEVLAAIRKDPSLRRALEIAERERVLAPQKASAYRHPIRMLEWTRDGEGLAALAKRLDAMPPFSGEDATAERKLWASGQLDNAYKSAITTSIARARDRVARAQKAGHQPTLAAAWMTLGDALGGLLYVEASPATADEMVAANRKAREAWAEGISPLELAGALATAAFVKAMPDSAALRSAWESERRLYGVPMLVHRAAAGAQGAEVLAALRRQPELRESIDLRRPRIAARPQMLDWMIARIAGDAEAEQGAAKAFERADLGASLRIEAKLFPGQPREDADLALFTSKGAATAPARY